MRYISKPRTKVMSKPNQEIGSELKPVICLWVSKLLLVMIPSTASLDMLIGVSKYHAHEA